MGRAVLEAEAVVSGFEDVAVVGEPVEQRGGHLCVAEDARPFTEAEVGGDDDAGALVQPAQQMEEQRPSRGAEWQVSQLVENDEIGVNEPIGDLSRLALRLLLLKRVDQFDRREEPHSLVVMLNGLNAERGGNVRLARARSADQDDIVGVIEEVTAMELLHESLVDLAAGKVEAVQITVGRKACCLELIGR